MFPRIDEIMMRALNLAQEPVHEQEENDDGELRWVMKWKKDFVFELSGDMRELRLLRALIPACITQSQL